MSYHHSSRLYKTSSINIAHLKAVFYLNVSSPLAISAQMCELASMVDLDKCWWGRLPTWATKDVLYEALFRIGFCTSILV